jgi:hypothetical protein
MDDRFPDAAAMRAVTHWNTALAEAALDASIADALRIIPQRFQTEHRILEAMHGVDAYEAAWLVRHDLWTPAVCAAALGRNVPLRRIPREYHTRALVLEAMRQFNNYPEDAAIVDDEILAVFRNRLAGKR